MSIFDKIAENVDYRKNFRRCRFPSKFANISILVKIFDFGQYLWKSRFWSKFMKISISVKIIENLEFGQYSWK